VRCAWIPLWQSPDTMGTAAPYKDCHLNHNPLTLMTADLAASLLNRAATGAELLEVLETIAADNTAPAGEPTLEEVQF